MKRILIKTVQQSRKAKTHRQISRPEQKNKIHLRTVDEQRAEQFPDAERQRSAKSRTQKAGADCNLHQFLEKLPVQLAGRGAECQKDTRILCLIFEKQCCRISYKDTAADSGEYEKLP